MFKSNLIVSLDGLYKTQADIIANRFKKHPILIGKDVRVITEDGESTVYVCIRNPLTLIRLLRVFSYGIVATFAFVLDLGYEPDAASKFFNEHLETYNSWDELG